VGTFEASLAEHALDAAATYGSVVRVEFRRCERPGPSLPRYSSVHLHRPWLLQLGRMCAMGVRMHVRCSGRLLAR